MKVSKSSLVLTAAFTGLLGGTMARLNAGVSMPGASGSGISSASAIGHSAGLFERTSRRHPRARRARHGNACIQTAHRATQEAGEGRCQYQRTLGNFHVYAFSFSIFTNVDFQLPLTSYHYVGQAPTGLRLKHSALKV